MARPLRARAAARWGELADAAVAQLARLVDAEARPAQLVPVVARLARLVDAEARLAPVARLVDAEARLVPVARLVRPPRVAQQAQPRFPRRPRGSST